MFSLMCSANRISQPTFLQDPTFTKIRNANWNNIFQHLYFFSKNVQQRTMQIILYIFEFHTYCMSNFSTNQKNCTLLCVAQHIPNTLLHTVFNARTITTHFILYHAPQVCITLLLLRPLFFSRRLMHMSRLNVFRHHLGYDDKHLNYMHCLQSVLVPR